MSIMTTRTHRAGFTLLELLAVILIVGILAGVLVTQIGGAKDTAGMVDTKNRLTQIEALIEDYERTHGAWPRSSFTPEQGVANDGTNVGVEALVVALNSNGWNTGGFEVDSDWYANTDGDMSSLSLTDFGNRKLQEFVDYWGNPIAYIHHMDYGVDNRVYVTLDEDGVEQREKPQAYRNANLGQWHKHNSFQLISAGSDGLFGTEDDITNFERE